MKNLIDKRCEFCGHLLSSPYDNRGMSIDPVRHGKEICHYLVERGLTAGHICTFCYAHVSLFRKEHPVEYEQLKQNTKANYVWVVAWFTDFNRFVDLRLFGSSELAHAFAKEIKEGRFYPEVYREKVILKGQS